LFNLNAAVGFDSYQWKDGSTNSTVTVNSPGEYIVTAQNFCGAQFKDSFSFVRMMPLPFTVYPSSVAMCIGDSAQFNASGGTIYSWQPANKFNKAGIASPKAVVNASQDFTVQISDPLCLRDTVIVIPVKAKDRADITIFKKNDVNCQLDSTQLIADGGSTYTWTPNLYITRSNNSQVTVKPPRTITYYVGGKDAAGCAVQDSVTVYFVKEGEQRLFVPNAFTPNKDGLNDGFKPVFTGPATKFDFRIFNRWGQLVFQTNEPGKGWDGMFRSIPQPKDVYVYYITAEGGCNGKFKQNGTFVLIK
jgi:gliding motility-associated-like protein